MMGGSDYLGSVVQAILRVDLLKFCLGSYKETNTDQSKEFKNLGLILSMFMGFLLLFF